MRMIGPTKAVTIDMSELGMDLHPKGLSENVTRVSFSFIKLH
jgi:hypothetical protein